MPISFYNLRPSPEEITAASCAYLYIFGEGQTGSFSGKPGFNQYPLMPFVAASISKYPDLLAAVVYSLPAEWLPDENTLAWIEWCRHYFRDNFLLHLESHARTYALNPDPKRFDPRPHLKVVYDWISLLDAAVKRIAVLDSPAGRLATAMLL